MECECEHKGVKSHDVVRNYTIAGNYNKCGVCGRVEWNWLTDELEMEINDSLYHYFVRPLYFSAKPLTRKPQERRQVLHL